MLKIRERMFVTAAKAMGAASPRIIARHIVPIVAPTLVTIAAVDFATIILAESALSFLGLGIQPPAFNVDHAPSSGCRPPGPVPTRWTRSPAPARLLDDGSLEIEFAYHLSHEAIPPSGAVHQQPGRHIDYLQAGATAHQRSAEAAQASTIMRTERV